MAISAIGAIGSTSVTNVYAALSPYLNGVVRTSDAAQAAQVNAGANATSVAATAAALATRGDAAATATASPPFINPAITAIGLRIALGQSLTPLAGVTPDALLGATSLTGTAATSPLALATAADTTLTTTTDTTSALSGSQTTQTSPFAQVAYGDAGELIQSYGAVALSTGPQALAASVFAQARTPYVAPAAIVTPVNATAKVA